jgi:hypothetical protein
MKKIKSQQKSNLPFYINTLKEIVLDNNNVFKIYTVKSDFHQTDFHKITDFYKPICRINEKK